MRDLFEQSKPAADIVAVGAGIGSLIHWMGFIAESIVPPVLGVVSLIWVCMQAWTWVVNKKWRRETK